jgi:Zn-dependent membrane protease YugP
MVGLDGVTLLIAQMMGVPSLGYLIWVAIPGAILSGGAAWLVRTRFAKYSKVPSTRGYTGQMAAQKLLDAAGIHDVKVVRVDGMLTDHYNPTSKQLALSSAVFDRTSVAAIGVATHEAGHAIQHATGYYPLKWRSAIVPAANIGTRFGTWGMVIGLLVAGTGDAAGGGASQLGTAIFGLGAVAFALFLLFQLVTLPVEFNASNRAKQLVVEAGIVAPQEREGIDKVLNAAAMTYVAAFVTSLLTLLYFLHRAGWLGGRRD